MGDGGSHALLAFRLLVRLRTSAKVRRRGSSCLLTPPRPPPHDGRRCRSGTVASPPAAMPRHASSGNAWTYRPDIIPSGHRIAHLHHGRRGAPGTPALPDGWTALPIVHPAGPVDARLARVATVPLDFSGIPPASMLLLLAIVGSSTDPLTAAELTSDNVRDLVLGSRHAAARTLWLIG